jgi:hypothetical protein
MLAALSPLLARLAPRRAAACSVWSAACPFCPAALARTANGTDQALAGVICARGPCQPNVFAAALRIRSAVLVVRKYTHARSRLASATTQERRPLHPRGPQACADHIRRRRTRKPHTADSRCLARDDGVREPVQRASAK